MIVSGVLTWLHWSDGTVFNAGIGRSFGIVVGVDLFPVAALLDYPFIHVAAALVTLVALASVPVATSTSVPISAVTGVSTGTVLLAGAIISCRCCSLELKDQVGLSGLGSPSGRILAATPTTKNTAPTIAIAVLDTLIPMMNSSSPRSSIESRGVAFFLNVTIGAVYPGRFHATPRPAPRLDSRATMDRWML